MLKWKNRIIAPIFDVFFHKNRAKIYKKTLHFELSTDPKSLCLFSSSKSCSTDGTTSIIENENTLQPST